MKIHRSKRSLCERVAEPLLRLHGKTTPPSATVLLGAVGLCIVAYGLVVGVRDFAWIGAIVAVIAWYGFLLCGCYRLVEGNDESIEP